MRADGVSEKTIARFVAEEMEEDEFRRSKGVTEIEALREWKRIPEHIRKLLLANAFCHNCGTTEFAPGYTLRMRHGCVSAGDHSWLASLSARAANHISSRRNTSLRIVDTSCDEKIGCAPFLLTSGSLNSRITYRRSFGCSLASSSSTTTVPPGSPSDSRTPLATSGRFHRPNQLETPPGAGVSPGRRSRQRTTPARNRTEDQDHGEIGAHFLRPPRSRGGSPAGKTTVTASADAGANRSIERNAPPSPVHPYREQKTGSQRRRPGPRRVAFIQLDASLNLREKRPGSSSRKRTVHLHRLNSATLLSAYRSLTVISAGQAALYAPGPQVAPGGVAVGRHRETSHGRKTFAISMDHAEAHVETRYL